MDLRTFILGLVQTLTWPIIVLILVLLFRKPLENLIQRIRKAKVPGGAEIEADPFDGLSTPEPAIGLELEALIINKDTQRGMPDWRRTWNLFWLANDIMWTKYRINQGAPRGIVFQGLQSAVNHAAAMGFIDTQPWEELVYLTQQTAKLSNDEFTSATQEELAVHLENVKQTFAELARKHQLDELKISNK
jgi:hypothetical protein